MHRLRSTNQEPDVTRGDVVHMACEAYGKWYPPIPAEMERFAALVAAHVRDRCVEICEGKINAIEDKAWNDACVACAETIKSMGKA